MELISAPLFIETDFQISLLYDLFTSMILVESAQRLEGISAWVTRTAAALPDPLASEMRVLVGVLRYCPLAWAQWSADIPANDPASADFDALMARLQARPAADFQALLLEAVKQELARRGTPLPASDPLQPDELRQAIAAYNTRRVSEQPDWVEKQADPGQVAQLVSDGALFKRRFLNTLESFWTQAYRDEFKACWPTMQRSVEIHRQRTYPADFPTRFQTITGRSLPDAVRQGLGDIQRMILTPSYHIGPYLIFAAAPPVMYVAFNGLISGGRSGASNGHIATLYPPLRALADETRLQILAVLSQREMYAQEVVEALGLSQSTASRHLQLLENTGVLSVRKENTAKYYSINPDKVYALMTAMKELLNLL